MVNNHWQVGKRELLNKLPNKSLPLSLPSCWDLGAQRLGNPTLDATCSPDNRRKPRYQGPPRVSCPLGGTKEN